MSVREIVCVCTGISLQYFLWSTKTLRLWNVHIVIGIPVCVQRVGLHGKDQTQKIFDNLLFLNV